MNLNKKQNYSLDQLSDCIKILSADAVESAKSGHPGLPLGFSQVMTCLAFEFLKFNPQDPGWFNRDRLILSAGHGSMLLYSFFYLTGYKGFSLNELKNFRQFGSKAAGHPENHLFNGIETTTGPLGQGLANAVGMAIAAKKYQAELGDEICNYKIYVIVGDGCLMEGISYEALSLAGHLKLDNLIVLFDDNGISIDGKTSLTVSENQIDKLKAFGFNAIKANGHDSSEVCKALSQVQNSNKPSFIAFKTKIGKGAKTKEGSEKSHGSPLGSEEIQHLKSKITFAGDSFYIPDDVKQVWQQAWERNKQEYDQWQKNFNLLPEREKAYLGKPTLTLPADIQPPEKAEATRVSSGRIIEALMHSNNKVIVGSADLSSSNGVINSACKILTAEDFSGNFIHYGVRENAMAAFMNGLSLSAFSPIGATFFVFSDYMRPSIRLSALMSLPVIFIMTHDSIGVGEDGPTHQPIEHLASFRAMPNIDVFRPADFIEVKECYEIAINNDKPSMIVLSRQNVPQIRAASGQNLSLKGGYVISQEKDPSSIDITIFATGSEVSIGIEVQQILELQNLSVRVCSVPCFDMLLRQETKYIEALKGGARKIAAIEAASSFGWTQIIGEQGIFFGLDHFGASAPADRLYKEFGLDPNDIAKKLY
ncbi:MAG: transketolase [Rickettsiaceae bacterium]